MENLKFKKTFLYTLITSIGVSALLGIWAILSGEFGEFQGKILSTTMTIVWTSILGLACGAFWESRKAVNSRLKIIPMVGIILTIISALIVLAMIWVDDWRETKIVKAMFVSMIFAFSFSQLSLLSLANLSKRFQWALTAVYLVVLTLALIVSGLIIIEPNSENVFVLRSMGVLGVIDAALTVIIPIFHRLSLGEFAETTVTEINEEIEKLKARIDTLERQKEAILNTKENKES